MDWHGLLTWDHGKDIVQGVGYLAAIWYTHRRTTRRLDRQDDEQKKIAQGVEWNNAATETIATNASLPPPSRTPLPPRPKVATLDDTTLSAIAAEVARAQNERKE